MSTQLTRVKELETEIERLKILKSFPAASAKELQNLRTQKTLWKLEEAGLDKKIKVEITRNTKTRT